ncbi:lytic transglycosylase domain-containing protein [Chelatococcus composti]|jgi:Soluble lytic murein transglycosylase and related regulatory proteins (some contain LysM/invasin domains)|nr:lytic transglycosylase domain-containing protein [Chelatococcus composti]MBS7735167.1 lytic transglycosylase domain-containing protein [Chelatococcus composti]PZN45129.1 MAG: lytic transglycosylase [Pseudomonadota bacterium]
MAIRAWLLAAIAAASISSVATAADAPAGGSAVCEGEITRAAAKYGVPVGVLYAVGLTETGRRGSMQPYAMNIQGTAYFAPDAKAAIRRFHEARRDGIKLIDLGCMQINHHYHSDRFPSLEAMLDPRHNVEYAARFLKELKQREGTWTMAVARYHAGPDNDAAQKRYVCRVIANLVAVGFGAWTPNARSFCS